MALNIHTDPQFEKTLERLARYAQKTKTDLIKELVLERYHLKKSGFKFGSLRPARKFSSKNIQKAMKQFDRDHDLD